MACFLYRSIAIFLTQLVLWAIFHFLTECFLFLVATLVVTSWFERLFVYEDDSSSPFRNSSGYVFYLRSNHTFSWFLKSNWSSDFRHAETGSGAKERVVLWWLFHSYFKWARWYRMSKSSVLMYLVYKPLWFFRSTIGEQLTSTRSVILTDTKVTHVCKLWNFLLVLRNISVIFSTVAFSLPCDELTTWEFITPL